MAATRRPPAPSASERALGRMARALEELYPGRSEELRERILELAPSRGFTFPPSPRDPSSPRLLARDAILISYPDMFRGGRRPPLGLLGDFAARHLAGAFTFLHILPFFPSSSDEGFSVMDYESVDPRHGSWADIEALGRGMGLAFDFVLNHASAKGTWFRAFLAGRSPYDRFFVTRPADFDGRAVFRPRTHPLLTELRREDGSAVRVWTTFSADQADLDFSEPEVLLAMAGILLLYAAKGARILRLDAVAFAWKDDGTNCLDRPRVHALVRLFRSILDAFAPDALLLSETNLPRDINDSYFGQGDEAQLVYNFSLPPLALHAFLSGRGGFLSTWASSMKALAPGQAYVNFLSSHDGIGLTPARGLLPQGEIDRLVAATLERGGLVSVRSGLEGPLPYELNTTFLDVIAEAGAAEEARARAFLSCHALMLSLAGIPAIYFHSLVGSRNWREGPAIQGSKRSIHRERLDLETLEGELMEEGGLRSRIYRGLKTLLEARARRPALAPDSPQRVLAPDGSGAFLDPGAGGAGATPPEGPFFALLRGREEESLLALVNLSSEPARFALPRGFLPRGLPFEPSGLSGPEAPSLLGGSILVPPRATAWLDGSYGGV